MKLTMRERLLILNILPEQGGVATIRIAHELRQSLAPNEEEWEKFDFRQGEDDPGMLFWRQDIPQETEVEIGKKALKLIKEALEKVDENEGVTIDLIPLFDKFVIDEDGD